MNPNPFVDFRIVPRTALSPVEKNAMFSVLAAHFDGVTPAQFARDLAEKNLALLFERESMLVGFSTMAGYTTAFEGEQVNVIYSGDTIIAPSAWGSSALPRAWLAGVETLKSALPAHRCFWLLLTSGFRTYRFLPVFWREFYPRFDAVTPEKISKLLRQLAEDRFGRQFGADSGIVRFREPQKLRPQLAAVPPGRDQDPHVAFFLSRNPQYSNGDELVCLTELCSENLTAAGRRMVRTPNYAGNSRAL